MSVIANDTEFGCCINSRCTQDEDCCASLEVCMAPPPAEAATEIGADTPRPRWLRREGAGTVAWPCLMALAVLAVAGLWHLGSLIWG